MSDSEPFVTRWSRLKQEKAKRGPAAAKESDSGRKEGTSPPKRESEQSTAQARRKEQRKSEFDVSSLPPIESITAGTDIRAFLQSGVPAELTKAALRRAWSSDPAIRDFIDLAENQWDFTDPTAMYGFGPLEANDDVRKLVARAMGRLGEAGEPGEAGDNVAFGTEPAATRDTALRDNAAPRDNVAALSSEDHAPPQASGMPDRVGDREVTSQPVQETVEEAPAATQHADVRAQRPTSSNRRGHGRALPQ